MPTVTDVLGVAGSVVTTALSWVSDTATTIASEPLLLVFITIPMVGLGVGLIKRMISL